MPKCPQCTKPLHDFSRRCPSCQADLDLLVDYVSHLQGGLQRAEYLTKAGELGQAIWAYLEVLEVDPDNPQARKAIAQVVTAVRQFDTVMPGRRWANGLPPELPKTPHPWWHWAAFAAVIVLACGFGLIARDIDWESLVPTMPPIEKFGPPHKGDERQMGGGRA